MGKSCCGDACSSRSSDDWSLQVDSAWDLHDENKEMAISSEKLVPSLRSGEDEVDSERSFVGNEGESAPSKGDVKGKYKCEVCGVMHQRPSLLKQHMHCHSEDDWAGYCAAQSKGLPDPIRTLKSRSFVCPVVNCGKQYKRQDHLNRHSLTHKGQLFPCTWEGCDLSFNVNSNLQRHLKLHEKWGTTLCGSKGDTQLICPESGCGKAFKYPSLLQTHIDNVHSSLSISQVVCMEAGCGEIFDSPAQLRDHAKVAHCYVFCETCGVSMLKTSLVAHGRTHEAEQGLISCPYPGCVHSYNKNGNLNTHIRAVHIQLKPYACSHAGCEVRFAYKSVRDKHEQCSRHAKPSLVGDFETEDLEYRLKSRGGRKRLCLNDVDDLLPQKWRFQLREKLRPLSTFQREEVVVRT